MANENRVYNNIMNGTLSAAINASTTTITNNDFNKLPVVGTTNHMLIVIDAEILKITAHALNSTTITVATRGLAGTQDATTATTHALGATWSHNLVASDIRPISNSVSASQTIGLQFGSYLVNATSAAVTLTLPAPVISMNLVIKKTDASANNVIITPPSGTIDGAASYSFNTQYQAINVISDGTNFYLV